MSNDPYSEAARAQVINRAVAKYQVRRESAWHKYVADCSTRGIIPLNQGQDGLLWPPGTNGYSEASRIVDAVLSYDDAEAEHRLHQARSGSANQQWMNPYAEERAKALLDALQDLGGAPAQLAQETNQEYKQRRETFELRLREAGSGNSDPGNSVPPAPPFSVNENLSQIRIGGQSHDVTNDAAMMAKLLLEANGGWVAMKKNGFSKPSETKRKLPPVVQEMIESICPFSDQRHCGV